MKFAADFRYIDLCPYMEAAQAAFYYDRQPRIGKRNNACSADLQPTGAVVIDVK